MSIPPLSPTSASGLAATPPAVDRSWPREARRPAVDRAPDRPDSPSELALEAVQAAARAYEELRSTDRELHFKTTEHGLHIEVYDADGELIRRIPPNEALALAAGRDETWRA